VDGLRPSAPAPVSVSSGDGYSLSARSGDFEVDCEMASPPGFLLFWRDGGPPPGCKRPTMRPDAAGSQ
jgi:hypothetical protein